ncbi:MAG TPA: gamma-glutamyltransferase [Myxococcaceae bacterium]|nr:gamma-glutamyltransferase [Myxococcaceae bacterium]
MDASFWNHAAPSFRYAVWLLAALAACSTAWAQSPQVKAPPTQARSMVINRLGIVATSQVLASRAGAQVLELGGNAVDAAIAANAVLGVVEPTSNGPGGDLFAIVYEAKTGKLYGLNASGWAPAKMTVDFVRSRGHQSMPHDGILTVTVPGCVAGWDALRRKFGTLPFETLLKPAIHYADEGFPVTERISAGWKNAERLPNLNAAFKQTFLPNGHAPGVAEIFRNKDLARSLRRIAEKGRDGFYQGPTAEAIVQLSRETGGAMEGPDLAQFQAEWVQPISTDYHGWTVTELPPNGQGIAALMMLNLMEQFPLAEYGHNSPKALHVMIEAKKLAYADLLRYVADPRFSEVPVSALLSKSHALQRAKGIQLDRAMASASPSAAADLKAKHAGDTIYMSAIDAQGNIVSLIQSNYSGFGSGLVAPGTGFGLQNRGALFSLEASHPNVLAPRKRPLHTIIPAFLQKGDVRIGFGIMGGWNQAQAHAQFVANVVDFGMNIQAALEAPRFTKSTFDGLDVEIEGRVAESTRAELTRLGHQLKVLEAYSGSVGGGQVVMRNGEGVNFGASDPRKDGAAEPQAPAIFGKQRTAERGTGATKRGHTAQR